MSDKHNLKQSLRTLSQKLVVFLLKMFSFLPFWLVYLISDFLYVLVEYIIGYRRKVIDENLRYSFPEKSKEELDLLRKKFYRHFCDLTLESIKLYRMSEEEMRKHFSFKNIGILQAPLPSEKGLILLAMHHNNWEWGTIIQRELKQVVLMVYNKMRDNVPFDNFLLQSRKKLGGIGVPMHNAARTAIEYKNRKEPTLLWLAADQSAPQTSQFWAMFMNREAPFFAGPVKLAQKLNQPLYFQRIRKISRSRYEKEFTLLFEEPAKVKAEEILLKYIQKMEEVIREEPEYYLWSHRRWKHSRPEGTKLIS